VPERDQAQHREPADPEHAGVQARPAVHVRQRGDVQPEGSRRLPDGAGDGARRFAESGRAAGQLDPGQLLRGFCSSQCGGQDAGFWRVEQCCRHAQFCRRICAPVEAQ